MVATQKKVVVKKAVRELKNLRVNGRQIGDSWWCFVCCYPVRPSRR